MSLFVIFFINSDSFKKKYKIFSSLFSQPSLNYLTATKLSISYHEEALEINQNLLCFI